MGEWRLRVEWWLRSVGAGRRARGRDELHLPKMLSRLLSGFVDFYNSLNILWAISYFLYFYINFWRSRYVYNCITPLRHTIKSVYMVVIRPFFIIPCKLFSLIVPFGVMGCCCMLCAKYTTPGEVCKGLSAVCELVLGRVFV